MTFWAWALISPLGPLFRTTGTLGTLTESDVALLVAVPVVVGSLGRIIVGGLTDRYGGRIMFPIISGVTILPVLFIAFFALDSYALLLVGGFVLGIAGTSFAVGVPFVNARFPPREAWSGHRHLRRRHGWYRDQRPDHRQAHRGTGCQVPLPHHGCRPGRVCRRVPG
uniref:MFS transporter n=1 Tax=Janibacter limosus TaxID=53458 RepID=A0AC61U380_9MICO|nr:MFS transporter [Janibacter limosus]